LHTASRACNVCNQGVIKGVRQVGPTFRWFHSPYIITTIQIGAYTLRSCRLISSLFLLIPITGNRTLYNTPFPFLSSFSSTIFSLFVAGDTLSKPLKTYSQDAFRYLCRLCPCWLRHGRPFPRQGRSVYILPFTQRDRFPDDATNHTDMRVFNRL
jgi:hypothetical protein